MPEYKLSLSKLAAKQLDKMDDNTAKPILQLLPTLPIIHALTIIRNQKDDVATVSV